MSRKSCAGEGQIPALLLLHSPLVTAAVTDTAASAAPHPVLLAHGICHMTSPWLQNYAATPRCWGLVCLSSQGLASYLQIREGNPHDKAKHMCSFPKSAEAEEQQQEMQTAPLPL